jgi:hypothetical protein
MQTENTPIDNTYGHTQMHTLFAHPFLHTLSCDIHKWDLNSMSEVMQQSRSASFHFQYALYDASSTYTKLSSISSQMPNAESIDFFPLAVRYHDAINNIFVVERPPFQIDIDYSVKKNSRRKISPLLKNRKVWVPWTVYVFAAPIEGQDDATTPKKVFIFYNDKQLSSLDDHIVPSLFPNAFADGSICFGDSISSYNDRVRNGEIKFNINTYFNYLINDYFTSWNKDLNLSFYQIYFDYFKKNGIIDAVCAETKRLQDDVNYSNFYWGNDSWLYFLRTLSQLSYEQMMDFIAFMNNYCSHHKAKTHNNPYSNDSDYSSYTKKSLSLRDVISDVTENHFSGHLNIDHLNNITGSAWAFSTSGLQNNFSKVISYSRPVMSTNVFCRIKHVDLSADPIHLATHPHVNVRVYKAIFHLFSQALDSAKAKYLDASNYKLNPVEIHVISKATFDTIFGGTDNITSLALKNDDINTHLVPFMNDVLYFFDTNFPSITIDYSDIVKDHANV